ncbi:hypothetical protein [Xanthomonas floridensis]|uniref:Uncharacterized protein n=1 Tax=Xanthomonas floridensis TaxID=1843580 RepID=A0A1A9MAC3_9XANT|nr:hypothetical protein [Xanthomonas floridensis]MEA5126128.1 hypothetical protein [Xanthomonas floridensis]MEA5134066.1 hypothetical protein [Xanthomonas floridensis]OAG67158.1 hypothetical protein A7D17_19250 [Xanthomonas floridensis]
MLVLTMALAVSGCVAEHARFALRDDSDVQAAFQRVASGPQWPAQLAVHLVSARIGLDAWFLPWNGGSDGNQHLASTTDVTAPGWQPPDPDGGPRPLGDIDYLGTDASYRILSEVPRTGMPAPAHFLLPDLGEALRYLPAPAQRQPARQFFDLVGCASP